MKYRRQHRPPPLSRREDVRRDRAQLIKAIEATDVFTPNSFPEHTYVHRRFFDSHADAYFDPEERLKRGLNTKGYFVSLVGPSKSGKTISVRNAVGNALVEITGAEIRDGCDFWSIALQKLRLPTTFKEEQETSRKTGSQAKASTQVGIGLSAMAEASVNAERAQSTTLASEYESSPLDTLVQAAKHKGVVFLLDDFHYIDDESQNRIAGQIKSAMERGVRICISEVPHGDHSLIRSNPDLAGRFERVDFSYWTIGDLEQIADQGFSKLGLALSKATVVALATEAGGSPQLMQKLCLAAARFIARSPNSLRTAQLNSAEIAQVAVEASSRDREKVIERLIRGPETRGQDRNVYRLRDGSGADVYQVVLLAITSDPPLMSLTRHQMEGRIRSIVEGNVPNQSSVSNTLNHMRRIAEQSEPKIRLLDVDDDGNLHVMDPYFFFELRWFPQHRKFRASMKG